MFSCPCLDLIWVLVPSGGGKKDRQGCEVLTLMLQALQNIVASEALPADRVLVLFEATVKGIPQRVLGSASYQVGKMDVLNGTPALFLIQLLYNSSMLAAFTEDERFFRCLQTLVGCGLSGPTSPLTFSEAVLGAVGRSAATLQNKEQLLRMWSVVVGPLTDTITQSNEVNQGDALEHNFSCIHSALMLPVTHLLQGAPLQQASQKSMLSLWSKLYKVFARCSALVATAEENVCCEELCGRMAAAVDRGALKVPSTLSSISSFLQVMVECVDFSPFTPQFQQKLKSPHTPVSWMKKRSRALGNISAFQSLLVQSLEVYLEDLEGSSEATGSSLVSILSTLFSGLVLNDAVQEALSSLVHPLEMFYSRAAAEPPTFSSQLLLKLEKLLGDLLGCLQTRSTLAFNDELLELLAPLLCVLFPHRNKQLRTSVSHFWNSTFANAVSLSYPEDLRSILSHVKQKTPIILPGFEVLDIPDELSGQYSSEGSQMQTTLSGIPVSSVGKKQDSVKDRSCKTPRPVPTKLDFSSPKPPRREVLEEEASIDFVFIPPEAKERVLTEHQKEVKRTKRVDIPAMYNNLDASLDSTVFSQFSQSQEDSQDKMTTEQTGEDPQKVPREDEANADVQTKDTQDYVSPKDPENTTENQQQEEVLHESADVSVEDDDDKTEGTSPNVSASSDMVSGTPQKPNSRRQSFITLEKYSEGKAASPSSVSSFTGPLVKTSSQRPSSKDSQTSSGPDSQDSHTRPGNSQSSVNDVPESPRRPKESRTRTEPVKLTERLPSDSTEDEDVIPDTQTEEESAKVTPASEEEVKSSSPEEESEAAMDDSQSTPDKSKRSRSSRVRPSLPGENPEEQEAKDISTKKKRSRETCLIESPQSLQSRPNTRSKQAAEESSAKIRLRRRPQQDDGESSQSNSQSQENKRKKIRLFSSSEDFLTQPQRKRRSTSEHSSSQTDLHSQSDPESQSQGRRGRRSKASPAEVTPKDHRKLQEDSQTVELVGRTEDGDETKKDSQLMSSPQTEGQSQESEMSEKTETNVVETPKESQMSSPQGEVQSQDSGPEGQTEKDDELKMDTQMSSPQSEVQPQDSGPEGQTNNNEEPKKDSEMSSPQDEVQSQDFELESQTKNDKELKKDSVQSQESEPEEKTIGEGLPQTVVSSPANDESQEGTSKEENKTTEAIDDSLSQEDSQVITPSSSDSQSVRRSRRTKASPEAEDQSRTKDSLRKQSRPNSQTEDPAGGRRRRSKLLHLSSGSTPESSQSVDVPQSESSQGRGRYSTRRSSPAVVGGVDSSESESSDAREASVPKKRGRKPRASLPSPLTVESKDRTQSQSTEAKPHSVEPSEAPDQLQVEGNVVEEGKEETPMEVEDDPTKRTDGDHASVKESDAKDVETLESAGIREEQTQEMFSAETLKPSEEKPKEVSELGDSDLDHQDQPAAAQDPQNESERPDVTEEVSDQQTEPTTKEEPAPIIDEEEPGPLRDEEEPGPLMDEEEPGPAMDKEEPGPLMDEEEPGPLIDEEEPGPLIDEEEPGPLIDEEEPGPLIDEEEPGPALDEEEPGPLIDEEEPGPALDEEEPGPAIDEDGENLMEPQHEESQTEEAADPDAALADDVFTESTSKDVLQDSPAKQKDLEALMEPGLGQSPSGGRTRGTWSPSASPSTSILKKGQKRPLKDETPSPLVKSRRVSFANPIQQQETADDIDRRSPAVRTSSPRRSRTSAVPQPKLVTTPTKGLLILSPRNLHSPGHKSSKKSLISELGQDPRPVSRDCIYPPLVGCSTPVEAVLPQISSNMWSRGFGQLVRARNIKTVGDLSALTPNEIKTLPIRSPKVSNVRKALRVYEQQRKGRGGDDLKSFDETEMMTSELEEAGAAANDDDKTSAETLATELLDESTSAADQDVSGTRTPEVLDGDQRPGDQRPGDLLLPSDVELLSTRMSPSELGRCSVQQLVQIHDQLGGLMRRVVVELQTRVQQTDL